jgi:hypothetical protein
MNLLEHFSRIYIVNLPERADRRREMTAELAALGLAPDGDRIRFFRAVRPDAAGAFPSIGARGCFLSHLGILEEAIADGLENVLVLEDDLAFSPLLRAAPAALGDRLAAPWDFAYFGHVAELHAPATPAWLETTQPLATTHFYALHGRILKPLRDYLSACLGRPAGDPEGGPMHVDGAYSLFRSRNPEAITLVATPSLGEQRSSRSDIFPNKWYDRVAATRLLASFARKLKNRHQKTAPGV